MPEAVYLVGSGRTDFKRNLKKEGLSLRDVIAEAGKAALSDAGLQPSDVQSGVVGNFAAGLFTRQLHVGALMLNIDSALQGIPTIHTEAACASGSVAVITAIHQIMAGAYDVVLVVGAEQQKTMSPSEGSDVLGGAGDFAHEKPIYGEFMFPKLFGRIAQLYRERYGVTDEQLSQVAVKNRAHAQLNPLAQTRGSKLTLNDALTVSDQNVCIAAPLKITDCSQITDGAAAVVLVSERFVKKMAQKRPLVKLAGFGHATDFLALDQKDVPEFPCGRKSTTAAYTMANLTPTQIDGAEVHDCFSISEIVAYELLGLAERGQGPALVASGATALPSVRQQLGGSAGSPGRSIPVNTGGGLIGDGHPVGATGVRQVVEAYQQLTEAAGERQVANARRYFTYNMGGSMTTCVSMIWQRN